MYLPSRWQKEQQLGVTLLSSMCYVKVAQCFSAYQCKLSEICCFGEMLIVRVLIIIMLPLGSGGSELFVHIY